MKNLIVFDFDWSLSDGDSAGTAFSNLSPEMNQIFQNILGKMEGYLADDYLFQESCKNGFYKEELLNCLKDFPIHPSTIELIKKAKAEGHDVVIISDGNDLFIGHILDSYGIRECISLILTNKAVEAADRSLRLVPFKHPVDEAHNCSNVLLDGKKVCNMNLCKGKELKELMAKNQYNKVIYTGDGRNDFCPMLQLRSQDIMCIRKDRSLEKLHQLNSNSFNILSKVEFWSNGSELYKIFETCEIF